MSLVCMVCCDSLFGVRNAEVEVVSGTCGHMIHQSCLQNWFRSEDTKVIQVARDTGRFGKAHHRACPTCRKEVDGAGFFRIYPSFEDFPSGEGTQDEISQSALREKCEDLGKVVCFLEKENEKLKQEVLIGKYTRPIGEEKTSSCSNCRKKKGKSRADKYPSAASSSTTKQSQSQSQLLQSAMSATTSAVVAAAASTSSNPFRMSSSNGNSNSGLRAPTYPQPPVYDPRSPSASSGSTLNSNSNSSMTPAQENNTFWGYSPSWRLPQLAPIIGTSHPLPPNQSSLLYRPYAAADGNRNTTNTGPSGSGSVPTSRYPQTQPMTPGSSTNFAQSGRSSTSRANANANGTNPFIQQQMPTQQQYVVNQMLTPPTTPSNYRPTPPYPIYKQLQQYPDPYIYNSPHNPFLPSPSSSSSAPSTTSTSTSTPTSTTSSYNNNQGHGQGQGLGHNDVPLPLTRSLPNQPVPMDDINRGGFDFDSIAEFALESSS